ncbi:hypothetical protein BGX29_002817 [Mortierella sp. GBA35]|nr:hypothetical protein BGX29_002817 [Mortierella sp. GBA35]
MAASSSQTLLTSWTSFPEVISAACSPCPSCHQPLPTSRVRKIDDSLDPLDNTPSSKRRLVNDKVLPVVSSAASRLENDVYTRSSRNRVDWLLVKQWQESLGTLPHPLPCQHQLDDYINTSVRISHQQEDTVFLMMGNDILSMRPDDPLDTIWAPPGTTTRSSTTFTALTSLEESDKNPFTLVPLLLLSESGPTLAIEFNVFLNRRVLSQDLSFKTGIDAAMQDFIHFIFPPFTTHGSTKFTDNPIKDLESGIVMDDGTVGHREPTFREKLPLSWELVSIPYGEDLIINRLYGAVSLYNASTDYAVSEPRGGILAEEMGLGKTVEMLALILLHERQLDQPTSSILNSLSDNLEQRMSEAQLDDRIPGSSMAESRYDPATPGASPLIKSAATLIITPPSILHQWAGEIENHAPSLSVFLYIGDAPSTISARELAQFDIVLTTYAVLSKEINYTNQYDRPRRHERRYCPRTSPIVLIDWWRVCLDEAQLIEGASVSQAAAMSAVIPRVMSWAISGTPIKRHIDDLYSLLWFLNQEPIASDKRLRKLLKERRFRPTFVSCLQTVMHRYAKQDVAHELSLPRQYRIVYGIQFTDVERMNYSDKWEQCLAECDLSIADDTSAEAESLQTWLMRLRQTCCHPQIGLRNMEALGKTNLRTINEVLSAMVRQAGFDLYLQEKGLVSNKIKRAILTARINKHEQDLALFHSIDKEISRHVAVWRDNLAEETARKVRERLSLSERSETVQNEPEPEQEEDNDEDDGDTIAVLGKSSQSADDQYMTAFLRHREWMLEHHRLWFFLAGVFHERGMTSQEAEYYERAESIRLQLLRFPESKFDRISAQAKDAIDNLAINSDFMIPASEYHGGIVMSRYLDELDAVRGLLNLQLEILGRWRQDLVSRLTQPLMQDGEEGEQYQYSIDLQHTLESYLHYYKRMLLLRRDLVTGTKEVIVKVVADAESQRERESMIKRRENRVRRFRRVDGVEEPRGEEDLDKRLEKEMDGLIAPGLATTLRSIRLDIKSLSSDFNMPVVERQVAESEELRLKDEQSKQVKLIAELEKEMSGFRTLTAARTAYYRQLQEISDTVRDIESADPQEDIHICLREELSQQREIVRWESKLRYLDNIATTSKKEMQSEDDRLCLVCRSQYDRGLITECGHVFCEHCLLEWTKAHPTCPTCNSRVVRKKLTRVMMSDSAASPLEEESGLLVEGRSVDKGGESLRESHLVLVPEDIRRTTIQDGYGSKIDSIVRHITYLVHDDPKVKCLVFSQWSNLLSLVGQSLDQNHIGYVKLDGASVKSAVKGFKENDDKHVFMLHAKSQSAYTFVHYYLIRNTVEIPCFELFERNTTARTGASNHHEQVKDGSAGSSSSALVVDEGDQDIVESDIAAITASQVSNAQNRNGELVKLADLKYCFRMQKMMSMTEN